MPLVWDPHLPGGVSLVGLALGLGLVLGGGCPRPWERQGFRLGLGVLVLAPGGDP